MAKIMSIARVNPAKLLYAILGAAAFLRLWGIAFGLPYDGITYDALTIEEIQEVHRALKLGAGEYSTVFGKGGLYLILFVEYGVYFVISWALGWVDSGREFAIQVVQDRTPIYVIGRVTVALMGVATCWVAYRIARRLYDERTGLVAALIGALAYYHAIFSGVVNVDIGCTLMLWSCLLVYLRYEETGNTKYLVCAGAVAAIAIAFKFPGVVAIPLIGVALLTAPQGSPVAGHLFRRCATFGVALLVTLTIIAPEWVTSIGYIFRFNFLAAVQSAYAAADNPDLHGDIKSITVMRADWGGGYLKHLASEYNVALTATAVFGAIVGALRKSRWEMIFAGMVVVFVGVMSLSDRTQPERYLLPIVPALWILGSRGALSLRRYAVWLPAVGIAVIVAMPTYWLIRAVVEKSQLDTRILAKHWIEKNVPAGARILMDGMRYRFSQAPPLNPDLATVDEKVDRALEEGGNFGRGVTENALAIYKEAMSSAAGPKYELVSTVHGLRVRDITYYVNECFDLIVTSSMVAGRFEPGARGDRFFPASAKFYASLKSDPRVRLVHEEAPVAWGKSGPTIQVYEVSNRCKAE
jgi:hypothetical protein